MEFALKTASILAIVVIAGIIGYFAGMVIWTLTESGVLTTLTFLIGYGIFFGVGLYLHFEKIFRI